MAYQEFKPSVEKLQVILTHVESDIAKIDLVISDANNLASSNAVVVTSSNMNTDTTRTKMEATRYFNFVVSKCNQIKEQLVLIESLLKQI